MAQWEEYYTGILPHAVGNYCGVTEVGTPLVDTRVHAWDKLFFEPR